MDLLIGPFVIWFIVGGGSLFYAALANPNDGPYPEVSRKVRDDALAVGIGTTIGTIIVAIGIAVLSYADVV